MVAAAEEAKLLAVAQVQVEEEEAISGRRRHEVLKQLE
jgi:hypothetical protein